MACWLLVTFVCSFVTVRGWIAYPLYCHEAGARGEFAYVMADGHAYWERLHAASDLYHMNKVPKILILDEPMLTVHSYARDRSETVVERAIEYLVWVGVPRDRIEVVPLKSEALFGTLRETESVADYASDARSIVVVTSAPHTRRCELSFRRRFPESADVAIYAASKPSESAEIDAPLWVEYTKLLVYWFVA